MRKKLVRILGWTAGSFLLLVLLFAAILYANRDRVIKAVLDESNELLAEPVQVEEIDVSLRKFPLASLRFTNVYCKGNSPSANDTLIRAGEMYFEFHLWKLLVSDFSIDRISLENGYLNIDIPASGAANYVIWKENKDTISQSSGIFSLEQVELHNFQFRFRHESAGLNIAAQLHDIDFSGDFEASDYHIKAAGDFFIDSLRVDTTNHLMLQEIATELELQGNPDQTVIRNGKLTTAGLKLQYQVDVLAEENVMIKASGKNMDLLAVRQLIESQNWQQLPREVKARGKANLAFEGNFPQDGNTNYKAWFETPSAQLGGLHNSELKNIKLRGHYEYKNQRDRLIISEFSGEGQTGNFEGSVEISDLDRPAVVLDIKSNLALNEWLIFLPLDTIAEPHGRAIVDLHLENRFKSLRNIQPSELKRTKAEGIFKLEEIGFKFLNSDKKIRNLNGDLVFANDNLKVNSFYFETGRSDIYLSGYFGNVLNYIFFEDEKLLVDTRVKSQELAMEDFLVSGRGQNANYSIDFVNSLDLDLNLQVDRFFFNKFFAEQIKGELQVHEGIIAGRSISLLADDGSFKGDFTIDTRPAREYELSANLTGKGADLHELFVSFDNFGQDVILSENIYGKADLNLRMTSRISHGLQIEPASVDLLASLAIQNGELKDYEPLMALSDYAQIDELRNVRFDRLENEISIKNSTINIPQMTVHNNVLDMSINGQHHFNNEIDYSLKLKLSDVLFKKRKHEPKNSEFDEHLAEVNNQDDPNIYIQMTGSAYDPVIQLDQDKIKRSIKQDLKEQGKELKNIFSRKKDDPKKTKSGSGIEYDLFGEEDDDEGEN